MKPSPELTRAGEAASEWAVQLAAGPLSAADEQALATWLEQDARNHARLEHYQRVYAQLGETVPRLVDSGELVEEPIPTAAVIRPPRMVFRRWATGLAAAAAIAATAVWWTGRPQLLSTPIAQRQTITLADGSQV